MTVSDTFGYKLLSFWEGEIPHLSLVHNNASNLDMPQAEKCIIMRLKCWCKIQAWVSIPFSDYSQDVITFLCSVLYSFASVQARLDGALSSLI